MNSAVKVGIVGFGYMGHFHLNKIRLCEDIEALAVYDVDQTRADEGRKEGLFVANSLDELLAISDINLIIVATPNDVHKDISIAALKAGKNVLCEKPAAMNAAEAREIVATAEKEGKFYTVHQNRRWDKDYLQVKKILQEKTIGNPTTINSWTYGQRGVCFGWRADPAKGGGMLYDWGVHLIDQILNLFPENKILRVFGRLESVLTPAVDDFFEVKLFLDNGVCANISVGTFALQDTPRWFVFGDRGTLKLNSFSETDGGMARIKGSITGFDSVYTKTNLGPSRTMAPLLPENLEILELEEIDDHSMDFYQNLIDAVKGIVDPFVSHQQIIRDMVVIDTVFESNRTKQILQVCM